MSSLWLVPYIAEIVWPLYVFALATIAFVAWDRRATAQIGDPSLFSLVALLVMPVVTTSWASLTTGAERNASHIGPASFVLLILTLTTAASVIWVLWRWRANLFPAIPSVLASCVAAFCAYFAGAMVIAWVWI
jgi:hypothetical protein